MLKLQLIQWTYLRFKGNTKVSERHYVRQDGTMTYFFTLEEMQNLVNQFSVTFAKFIKPYSSWNIVSIILGILEYK